MNTPTTTEQLEDLVVDVDAAAERRGWNEGPFLVRIEPARSGGTDESGFDLGFKPVEGHPLDTLLGFTAPPAWLALGVCAEGWAASAASAANGRRPSESKGRMRVRSTTIVSRSGRLASGVRLAGGELEQMGGGTGAILDALRRAMGVDTPPPDEPYVGWVARVLLQLIIGDAPRGHRRVPWNQLRPSLERSQLLAGEGSWEMLRGVATRHAGVVAELAPEVAAWMDEGMFARWVIGGLPSYGHLLEGAHDACTAEAFTQLRRQLTAWGLPTRVGTAA